MRNTLVLGSSKKLWDKTRGSWLTKRVSPLLAKKQREFKNFYVKSFHFLHVIKYVTPNKESVTKE